MAKFILSAFADEAAKEIDKQIEALKRNNISYIEIRNVDGKNIIKLTDDEVLKLKEKLDASGIKTWSIGSPIGKIGILDDFDPHLKEFKRSLEIAKMLDCNNIRLFSFFIPERQNPDDYRDEVMTRMQALLDYSKDTGIDLCHENEKGIYGDNLERNLDLLNTLGPDLKGIFDPSNYIQCKVKTLDAFKKLKEKTKYLHIKDGRLEDGKVVPAGFGDGQIKEILEILNEDEGEIVLSIEPHLTVFEGFANLADDTVLGTKDFTYESTDQAFDAACDAIKKIIDEVEK